MKLLYSICLLILLAANPAAAAPDILVEGSDGTFWQNINDGDLVPNQAVTDFDRVNLGSFRDRTYRVRNTDNNDTLTISSSSTDNSQFTIVNLQNGNIAGNASNAFIIRFTPTSRGTKTAVITIRSNDPDAEDPYTFAIEGIGEGPEITMSGSDDGTDPYTAISDGDTTPSTATGTDFGTIAAGNTRDRFFRIKNDGDSGLTYEDPTITGPNAGSFEVRSLSSIDRTISAGNNREFEIRFNPTTAGVKTATFNIRSNDQDEDPYTFTLTGTATGDPDIEVQGRESAFWNDIADGDLNPDQAVTDFGNVNVGSFQERTYRIRNTGNDTLTISSRTSGNTQYTFGSLPAGTNVAPDAAHEFTIRFTPTSSGTKNSLITIVSNDPGAEATYTFDITGVGKAPEITMSGSNDGADPYTAIADGDTTPSTATGTDFGSVAVGNQRDRFFRVKNDGNDGLNYVVPTLTGPDASQFNIRSLSSVDTIIGEGNSRNFEIRFEPTSAGTKTATFRMESNDADESPYTFSLTGVATVAPDIRVRGIDGLGLPFDINDGDLTPDQAVTDFGNVRLGAISRRTYRIHNDGTSVLNITSITSSAASFTFSSVPASVPAGGSADFFITFTPVLRSTITPTITVNSNDPDSGNPYTFAVSGTGEGPEIVLEGRGDDGVFRNIPSGTASTSTTTGTDFGSVNVTGGNAQRSFRIRNNGDKALNITGRSFSSGSTDYDVSNLLILGIRIINPGNSIEFIVNFDPTTSGTRGVTLTINNDDSDEDPYTFALTGNGVGSPEIKIQGNRPLEPRVEIADGDNTPRQSGGTLFADTATGSDRTHNFRIHNDGDGRLTFNTPTLTGADPAAFQILGFTTTTLDPGGTKDFNIRFAPNSFGLKTAVFSLGNSDDNENPYNFTIQGLAQAPDIALRGGTAFAEDILDGDITPREADGTQLGFVAVSNQSVTRTFQMRNAGNLPLTLNSVTSTNAQFTIAGFTVGTILAGGQVNLDITFDPSSVGLKTGTINISTNDPNEAIFNFRVEGFGTNSSPAISLTGDNNTVFTNNQTATSTAAGTDFGQVNAASGSVARTFRIENTGTGPLNLTGISSSSLQFTLPVFAFSPVNPGSSFDFVLTYDPNIVAVHGATITITSNAAAAPSFTFNVRGEGIVAAAPARPEIDLFGGDALDVSISSGDLTPRRADSTDFLQAEAGTPVVKTFRIRNSGTAALNIASAAATGTGSISGVAASIPAGGSDDFTVTINRQNSGTANVTVTIQSNDANEASYTWLVTLEVLPATSVLALTEFALTGTDAALTFTSVPGRTYRVASTPDLSVWTPMPGFTGLSGDSTPQRVVLPNAADPAAATKLFFRLEEE
jgi:Abnormal spindle-like microcephaly-assoc'd, ASPM-SPD-2-Hydin/Protein of unknown function (DUF1573)